jgi:HD-GYP domain-containing protein (c-di-GMP phosphodiesterase class II)
MVLALPVYNPVAHGTVLLKRGYVLSQPTIDRLKELRLREVWVHYPGLEAVDRYIDPQLMQEKAELAEQIRGAFSAAERRSVAKIDFNAYISKVGNMINNLLANPALAVYTGGEMSSDQPLMDHCMRVTYLCVLMGLKLENYLVQQRRRLNPQQAQDLTNLGVGAMVHDIGLVGLGIKSFDASAAGHQIAEAEWQRHVHLGVEMVGERLMPTARVVVLHHHQHFDGTGFPTMSDSEGSERPLRGEQIHIYARIACVANTFDRLCYPEPGKRVPAVVAIRQMLADSMRGHFDPRVLRAFLEVTPAYPPGTLLKLTDGRSAVAVDHCADDPCRPTVHIVENELSGQGELLDLATAPQLSIQEVDGMDVSAFNFRPPNLAAA